MSDTPARTVRIEAWDMTTTAGTVTVTMRRRGELWEIVTWRNGREVLVQTAETRDGASVLFAAALRAGLSLVKWVDEVRT